MSDSLIFGIWIIPSYLREGANAARGSGYGGISTHNAALATLIQVVSVEQKVKEEKMFVLFLRPYLQVIC